MYVLLLYNDRRAIYDACTPVRVRRLWNRARHEILEELREALGRQLLPNRVSLVVAFVVVVAGCHPKPLKVLDHVRVPLGDVCERQTQRRTYQGMWGEVQVNDGTGISHSTVLLRFRFLLNQGCQMSATFPILRKQHVCFVNAGYDTRKRYHHHNRVYTTIKVLSSPQSDIRLYPDVHNQIYTVSDDWMYASK